MNFLRRAGVLVGAFFMVGAAHAAEPLVTADWLQDNLENKDVRVFEVSVDTGVYERGHIPGAVHLDWHTELVDPTRRDIASREDFEKKLREAGVTADTHVVLYGDNNNWFAAWGAWVFNVYGIEASLLDGGRKLWEAKGLPLDTAAPQYAASEIVLPERNDDLRARFTEVLDIAEGRKQASLVDIRSNDEYTGKVFAPEGVKELAVRAGHIPGAENVPWGSIVQEDGTFKPAEEIKAIYAAKGIDGSKPIVT
jgi:thiosulfate/3-mercaptopyruvate sulfurtransferase